MITVRTAALVLILFPVVGNAQSEFVAFEGVDSNDRQKSEMPIAIRLSPGGDKLAIGTSKGRVIVFEAGTGKVLTNLPVQERDGSVFALDFSPNGGAIAYIAGGRLQVVEISSGKHSISSVGLADFEDKRFQSVAGSLAFAPGGEKIVVGGAAGSQRGCYICLIEVPSLKLIWPAPAKGPDRIVSRPTYAKVFWAPNGEFFASSKPLTAWSAKGYRQLWAGRDCVPEETAISRDSKVMVVTSRERVCAISSADGTTLRSGSGFPYQAKWIAISDDQVVLGYLGGQSIHVVTAPLETLKPSKKKPLPVKKASADWITHFAISPMVKTFAIVIRKEQPGSRGRSPVSDYIVQISPFAP